MIERLIQILADHGFQVVAAADGFITVLEPYAFKSEGELVTGTQEAMMRANETDVMDWLGY